MTQHAYHRWCSAILLLLTLIAFACLWSIQRTGLQIDTNLRSLSPSFSLDADVNQALNTMSAKAAQEFMLVLVNDDEDRLADASEYLRELIDDDAKGIRYQDQTSLLDAYAAQLKQHSFFILGDQARELLAQQNADAILTLGERNLYGSGAMLRLIPVAHDPMGFANDYAVGLLDRLGLNPGDDVRPVLRDGAETFIAVHQLQLANDALEMNQQDMALASLQAIKARFRKEFSDVEIMASGILFFAADSAQSARADIQTITTGSMIGVLLLILWVFRSPRALLLPVLSIALGLGFAFSICHYWFGSIHVLTLVFGSSLIGVVVDYALHYFYFQAHHPQRENRLPLYRALLLSLLTSAIGFSALAWSGLAALQQIAIFAALGLVYAWMVVIALGHYLTKNVKIYDSSLQALVRGLLRILSKLPTRWVLPVIMLLLLTGFSVTGFILPASDNPRSFFAANPKLMAQEKQINEWAASHEPASFILVQGDTVQQVYDRIAQVQSELESLGSAADSAAALPLLGAHLFFPAPAQQQNNYLLNARLYGNENIAGRFIDQQGLSEISAKDLAAAYLAQQHQLLNPADFFNQQFQLLPPLWIQSDVQINALLLIPKAMDVKGIASKLQSVPGARFFSALQDAEAAMQDLRIAAMQLLFLALGLMALLLLSRYTLQKTLQLMAIPFFAVSLSFMLLALFNIPLTLFHVMALFLVVGLGMDYVIFIAEMVENAVETLSAIMLSSITNLLSFGLLSLSILPAVSAFGTALFIGGCLNLFGALLLASRRLQLN